jgi:hypothetical protein
MDQLAKGTKMLSARDSDFFKKKRQIWSMEGNARSGNAMVFDIWWYMLVVWHIGVHQ